MNQRGEPDERSDRDRREHGEHRHRVRHHANGVTHAHGGPRRIETEPVTDGSDLLRQQVLDAVLGIEVPGLPAACPRLRESARSADRERGQVVIGSAVDESNAADQVERRANAATVKRALSRLVAREAPRRGDLHHLDIAVVHTAVELGDDRIVVKAEVRVAVSGTRGALLHVFVGGARVEIDSRSYRASRLPGLRADALEGAVEAVFGTIKRVLPPRDNVVAAR
ncbi:MAG: hypothetical protein JWP01_467 [Myxococcales bacterium]|nr:hypothetical protein [Myxococcales bacterium]